MARPKAKISDRLEAMSTYDPNSGCQIWTGSTNIHGYGQINVGSKVKLSHRVSWELSFGTIERGKQINHKCDTPACININHLFIGTQKDNMADCSSKGRMFSNKKDYLNLGTALSGESLRAWENLHKLPTFSRRQRQPKAKNV